MCPSTGRIAWQRWWLPRGFEPHLVDGVLVDPGGEFGRYVNPKAVTLPMKADVRCLVLLGDGGLGKSDELEQEAGRFAAAGTPVRKVDLARYGTPAKVEAKLSPTSGEVQPGSRVALCLDSFDEVPFSITDLATAIADSVESLGPDRVLLRIASRPAAWSGILEKELAKMYEGSFEVLVAAPLTWDDVRLAAGRLGNPGGVPVTGAGSGTRPARRQAAHTSRDASAHLRGGRHPAPKQEGRLRAGLRAALPRGGRAPPGAGPTRGPYTSG